MRYRENRTQGRRRSGLAGVSLAVLAAAAAFASPASAQAPGEGQVEEVVVTGSRIVRDGFTAPTPTTVLGLEEIQKSAPVNIANFVNELPQLSASTTPRTGNGGTSAGTNGINSLNLRSLGTNRTLVLLDGQRVAPVSINGAVDINNLPSALVQRVEVVTGGASAAYGSDAVAGVVNFILDKNFTGIKGTVSGGITDRSDDRTYNVELAYGSQFANGRGHFLASGELAWTQGVSGVDPSKRDWWKSCNMLTFAANVRPQRIVACGVNTRTVAKGGVITSTALANTQFGPGGTPQPFVVGSPVDTNFMVGGNVWSEGNITAIEGAQKRRSLWSRISYDLTDNVTASFEAAYGRSETQNGAAYQRFPGSGTTALVMRADNPYLDPTIAARAAQLGITTFNFGYSSFDLDRPYNWANRESFRSVASLAGSFWSDWRWDAYYQYGQTKTAVELRNTTNSARFREAIDATRDANGRIVCRSTLTNPSNGCVPLNVFGVGVASPEAIAYVKGVATQNLTLKQHVAAFSVSGDVFNTWAGPVSVAAGGEYREESIGGTADPLSLTNGWFTGNFKPTSGDFSVKEGFGEIIVPLASNAPLAQSLEFNGAARLTDYSLSGTVTTWKAGLSYVPVDDIRIRAVRSRDIRAPNVGELFQAGATARQDVIDTFQPNAPSVSIQRVTSGNVNLRPEIAKTTSLGVVIRPRFLPQLQASIDYYSINISGAVATINNQQTVDRCLRGETELCPLIVRNAQGTITQIFGFPVNVATQKTRGLDYEVSWRQNMGDLGNLTLRALATNILDLYTVNGTLKTVQVGENSGGSPNWRWLASVTYDYKRASLTLSARGFSDGVYDNTWVEGVDIDDNDIEGATYFNLNGQYRIKDAGGRDLVAFFTIENLFDKDPEIVASNAISGLQANPTLYDVIGRNYRVGLRFRY